MDSYNIDQHDYSVRLKAARKFLKDGDKVGWIILYDVDTCCLFGYYIMGPLCVKPLLLAG